MQSKEYEAKVRQALNELGISLSLIEQKSLPLYHEAQELMLAEIDCFGKAHLLVPPAVLSWHTLKDAARQDRIELEIVSAFRNIEEQIGIIRAKIEQGLPMGEILKLSAPPGYSEHHSGYAVDINTPGSLAREEIFENTDAFRWLSENAHRHGYTLSYPRGNISGFIYEPWHWFYCDADESPLHN